MNRDWGSGAKAPTEKNELTAALKRCATQNPARQNPASHKIL
jgi:hypothetical protein